jgi:hypothetical protein
MAAATRTRIPREQRYHLGQEPTAPPAAPVTGFASLPLVVRLVLLALVPLGVWLAVCLLAVGGWALAVVAVPWIAMCKKKRRPTRRRRR